MHDLAFPSNFLWGTATAPVQNEGSLRESSWWAWERWPGAIRNGDRSGVGCDWWANERICRANAIPAELIGER